jgi:hypothetical protein
LPPISASGFLGNRVEPSLAGMTTKKSTFFGAELILNNLENFVSTKIACFLNQHHRNIISNGISKTVGFANKFMLLGIKMQLAFAQRANQDIK